MKLSGSVDDDTAAFVDVYVNNKFAGTASVLARNWSIDVSVPAVGVSTVRVEIQDGAGNLQTRSLTVTP